MDGVVILNEAVAKAKKEKMERIFFKIAFVKAYDSVDWNFLNEILKCFNFCDK